MKILFLAPGVIPPYSEGRKRFVVDLAVALRGLGHRVLLLTSGMAPEGLAEYSDTLVIPASHRLTRLLAPLPALGAILCKNKPDLVISFPFGTFSGIHYLPSRLFMVIADRSCRARRVPCLTVLYSLDRCSRPEHLAPYVSQLITGQIPGWQGPSLPLGRDFDQWSPRSELAGMRRRILFLAGMWQPTRKQLDHVLQVRGLVYLLQAGERLAAAGFSLHVSVPLLSAPQCQVWLRDHPSNTWPIETLALSGESEVPAVFHEADVFVFPYAEDITQFTPTSVVEAMCTCTPVAMSDLPFLRPLAEGGGAALFAPRDPVALAECLMSLLADQDRLHSQVCIAAERAMAAWGITQSAKALLVLAG
jgi:hypothetical protein